MIDPRHGPRRKTVRDGGLRVDRAHARTEGRPRALRASFRRLLSTGRSRRSSMASGSPRTAAASSCESCTTSDDGWRKRGVALPFENTHALTKWLKRRRRAASPDGYAVLEAFLGKQRPEPVVDRDATYSASFSPAHASELIAIASRADVTVSAVVETSWHLGKRAVYDRFMAKAAKRGLDLDVARGRYLAAVAARAAPSVRPRTCRRA